MISLTIQFGIAADTFDPHTIWLLMAALALVLDANKRADKRRKDAARKANAPPCKKPPGPRAG